MAITVTREPQAISPSKNPIIYHLQSDARIDNPGTAAINEIQFAGPVADGTIVAIRWKGVEQRMVARTTVSQPGFEFPAGTASSAYLAQILPYFRDNYYLDEDFEITSQTVSGVYSLLFTSRQPGTLYNFETRVIPGVKVQVKTAGIERKVKPNFSIYVEAWIEKADGSAFDKIFAESLQTDESGRTEWDLSDLLHPELSPDIHQLEGRQFNKDINSKRRYYIRYAEAWGTSYQIGKITKGPFKHVTLGGTPYESGAAVTIMDLVRESSEAADDRALRLGPDVRYVYPDEPQFLTFLNTRTPNSVSLKVVAKLAIGGETSVLNIPLGSILSTYGRATVSVGYQQLNLNEITGGNAIESYTVQLFSLIAPASRPYTYVLKYEYKPYRRYFVYVNSLGALDTMHTWGKNSQEIELVKRSAEKYLSPDYKLTDGTFADWDISYRQRFEAATGYRHAHEVRGLRDFYISRYKWRKFNDKALPITVLSNTLREYEDGASLIAQSFEYAYNFEDDTFSEQQDTPDQYAPPPGFQGAAGAPIVIKVPPFPGVGVNGNYLFDPEPTQGSYNLVRSGDLYKKLIQLQSKLPSGLLGQYLRGDQTLGDFLTDSLQVVNNRLPSFKQEEFPQWIQDQNSSGRIAADESIDAQGGGGGSRPSGLYYTPATSTENGWPVGGKKGALVRIVNGTVGSRTGSDMVTTSDGKTWVRTVDEQLGNSAWKELGADARHPRFTNLPRITVTKGENFIRYINLATYKDSYHTLTDLTVEINLNTLKSKGLEVIKDGLLLTFSGKFLDEISLKDDNVLIYVTDQLGNQTTLSLKIGTLPDDPEPEPDTRPVCPIGPDFFGEPQVINNGKIKFGFDAEGVPDIRVKIYVPGVPTAIRGKENDLIAYNNGFAIREIEFEPLAPGPYDMSIEGSLCRSIPDIKRIIIPEAPTGIAWAEGFPLHETTGADSQFVCKITGDSGDYSTKVINLTTLVEQYSASREFVAGVSEVTIPKTGGWPAGNYQIMVGTLTATITVGEVVSPTRFLLKSGWDGNVIADLSAGPYNGPVPSSGFNGYLQSSDLGFSYKSCTYKLFIKVAGVWTHITSAGGSFVVSGGTSSSVLNPVRLFANAGVDSRYVLFNGSPINRYGEFKLVYEFRDAATGGNITGTIQQEFKLNLIEITGNWKPGPTGGFPRLCPVVSGVKYNGVNMVADNVWAEPWKSSGLADRRVEYSVDLVNWYRTSSWFDYADGTNSPSTLLLLNTPSIDLVDPLPSGKVHTVYLRDGMNHKVVSAGLRIDQGGVIGTEITAKATTSGYPPHMKLTKTKTPTGWLITDESTVTPPSGYHIRYYINRQIIELPGSLTGYAYNNNKPLGIYKGIIRNGATSLWGWANGDPGIGQAFSDNCSIAFETIIFNKK